MKPYHTSERSDWETPPEIWEIIRGIWHPTLDVCATPENAKCPLFFTEERDALGRAWAAGVAFMNPPYGRGVTGRWMAKAHAEVQAGNCGMVVCLLPVRTGSQWWKKYVSGTKVHFLVGRVRFMLHGQRLASAPFDSAISIVDANSRIAAESRAVWPGSCTYMEWAWKLGGDE